MVYIKMNHTHKEYGNLGKRNPNAHGLGQGYERCCSRVVVEHRCVVDSRGGRGGVRRKHGLIKGRQPRAFGIGSSTTARVGYYETSRRSCCRSLAGALDPRTRMSVIE